MTQASTRLQGWAGTAASSCRLIRPGSADELAAEIKAATKAGLSVCPRGGGYSYGDVALNEHNIVCDTSGLDQILAWDPAEGVIDVEPGVPLHKILARVIPENWMLPVVPGTRFPTVGGATSNNVHGKNSFAVGNFGDYVTEVDLLLADGSTITCSRQANQELFRAAIGGLGLLGVFTRVQLKLARQPSPAVKVHRWTASSLEAVLSSVAEAASNGNDHVIAWIDCFARGRSLGRGTIHAAKHVDAPLPDGAVERDLRLPQTGIGVAGLSLLVALGRLIGGPIGMRWVSALKYRFDGRRSPPEIVSFPAFNFLLDRVPTWPRMFRHGFVEYEPLVPQKEAPAAFRAMIKRSQELGVLPFFGSVKLHRADDFLLSYSMDGFSIGLDYALSPRKSAVFVQLFADLDRIVEDHGGLVYAAKDHRVAPEVFRRMYDVEAFTEIKQRVDPTELFQSDLYRRLIRTEEIGTCGLCGVAGASVCLEDVADYVTGATFDIRRCRQCGLAWTDPAPSSLEGFYPPFYRKYKSRALWALRRMYTLRVRGWAKRLPGGRRALDVGCGDGWMLSAMRDSGWRVIGSEISISTARSAAEENQVAVFVGELDALHSSAQFDFVILSQVLEHVSDPFTVLRRCTDLLPRGGAIVVVVPNFSSWQARFFGRSWLHLDVPRHQHHFSPQTLRYAMEKAGLKVVRTRFASLEHDPIGWVQSALNSIGFKQNLMMKLLMGSREKDTSITTVAVMIGVSVVLVIPSLLLSVFSWGVGAGAIVEVWCVKE